MHDAGVVAALGGGQRAVCLWGSKVQGLGVRTQDLGFKGSGFGVKTRDIGFKGSGFGG